MENCVICDTQNVTRKFPILKIFEFVNFKRNQNMRKERNKYLIIGGAGFIGSHLTLNLLNKGKEVTVIDDLSNGSADNLSNATGNTKFHFIEGNAIDMPAMEMEVEKSDFVFNFAAKLGIDYVLSYPSNVILNNILVSERICRLCLKYGKPLFLSSSSEVYGKKVRDILSEEDLSYIASPKLHRWSYSISKIAEEFIAMDYKRKGLKVLLGRYFNVVGPKQNKSYGFVIPKFIHQAINGEAVTVYGNGTQRRAFCDIRDLLSAIFSLLDKFDELAEMDDVEYNIGNSNHISIEELAEIIIKRCESQSTICHVSEEDLPAGFDEIPKRVPSTEKIKRTTGWQAQYSLNDTLDYILSEMPR